MSRGGAAAKNVSVPDWPIYAENLSPASAAAARHTAGPDFSAPACASPAAELLTAGGLILDPGAELEEGEFKDF